MDARLEKAEDSRLLVRQLLGGKTSKESANYRDADENYSGKQCRNCEHYLSPGEKSAPCNRVAGTVKADDVCDLFARAAIGGTARKEA